MNNATMNYSYYICWEYFYFIFSKTSSTSSGSNHHRGSSFKTWGPPRTVEVKREAGTGLGLSIVGGKVDGGSTSGIFIKNVIPDSPAGHTGQLCTGDRIVQIGNQRIESSDQEVAVNAIKNAGNTIQFVVQSLQTAKVHILLIN